MSRKIDQGHLQIWFVPTIADSGLVPTAAECAAGADLTGKVMTITGWASKTNMVKTPDGLSRFVSQIPGTIDAADSSLTIYHDTVSNPLRTTLAKDEEGFIVFFPENPPEDGDPGAGDTCDVFPVLVASTPRTRQWGDNASVWTAEFAITAEPQEDLTVSA